MVHAHHGLLGDRYHRARFHEDPVIFYILRFLLGVCEAGFFPGVLFVLTLWFPFSRRAKMVGSFMLFSAVANAVGAPIGGMLLDLDGALGLRGWEWVFIVTGIPAVIMGFVTFFYLDDRPEDCRFLSVEEKPGCMRRWRLKTASWARPITVIRWPRCSTVGSN